MGWKIKDGEERGGGANVNFRRVLKNERCVRSYEYHISSLRILDFLYFYPYVNTFIKIFFFLNWLFSLSVTLPVPFTSRIRIYFITCCRLEKPTNLAFSSFG